MADLAIALIDALGIAPRPARLAGPNAEGTLVTVSYFGLFEGCSAKPGGWALLETVPK
jgi:hypothetical protein